ncbi:MAG: TldD/PmbA family protein [Chloroflexi bacterium]|nr:TldD/PmbA family protein [Chloroflexota bacterium]
MQDRLITALRQLNTPYAEMRLERCESTAITFRGDQLESIDTSIDYGGFTRALATQGGWGAVMFTGEADLRGQVLDAIRLAHTIDSDPITLASIAPITDRVCADLAIDFRSVALADKQALIAGYNDQMLRCDPRIESTYVSYFDTFVTTWYANTDGTFIYQERPLIDLQLTAIARDGDAVQRGSKSLALARGYEAVIDRSDLAQAAAQLALEQLSARRVRSRRYTVVLDPIMAGLFTHEAFGHLSEADFIAENPQAQAMMTLGRQFGPRNLNIFDDGSVPHLRGSAKYDDEGVPMQKTWLMRDGVLVGRLHSRETAGMMHEQPTGNGRATSYRYAPQVRMTNTAIAPSDGGSLHDLIRDVDLGVYACDWAGGETMLEDFTFVAKHGCMIRKGRLAEPLRAMTLTGNLFETLNKIDGIGSDFAWDDSSGDCGKGAEGLAVCDGGPHLRIRDVLVGGA